MNRNISVKGFHILAIIIICLGLGFMGGTYKVRLAWKNYVPILGINSANPPPPQTLNMNLFYDVLERVNRDYYDKSKIDSNKLLYGAISGALASLDDPYTSFFPPKQNTDFKSQLSGEFSGIGAELGLTKDNKISVVAPLDGSPAQKAGIKSGDIILKVEDKDTTGWTLPQAVEKIRGPKGSAVNLTILHEKEKNPSNLKIIRDTITIKSVIGSIKAVECTDNKCQEKKDCEACVSFGYIRLSQFGDKTNDEWVAMVNKLLPEVKKQKNFKGFILDIRNNPGGYLQDAVFIASEFLKDGVVVIQDEGNGNKTPMNVSRKGLLTDYPLFVLINKGSASASEIVAGALRDYGRAKLIGEKSFGKGTIQQAVDLDRSASVHVTIAKWLTPNGTWVHKVGLEPDIKVEFDAAKSNDSKGFDNQLQRAIQELAK